jgi:flagellar hook-associated protein 3 FlgL
MMLMADLYNLDNNQQQISTYQNQLSSGKQLTEVSDNPTSAAQVLALQTTMSLNTQYLRNVDAGTAWLNATDSALQGVNSVLQRAQELAVQGANDTQNASDRQSIATEVNGLLGQAVELGNSTYAGNYIFAGAQTTIAPFAEANGAVSYANSDPVSATTALNQTIGPDTQVTINTIGHDPVGGNAVFDQVFNALTGLSQALNANDTAQIQASIQQLSDTQNTLSQNEATVGARLSQLSTATQQLNSLQNTLGTATSNLQDTDMAQAATYFAQSSSVQQAALQATAKSLPPSLFSYLA